MDRRQFLKAAGAGALLMAIPGTGLAQSTACGRGQYYAQYYVGQAFNRLRISRCEAAPLNKDWGAGPIAPMSRVDDASARWIGNFDFQSGEYKFTASTDDGIRVYVDGVLVIDEWRQQPATTYTATRTVDAGTHQVKVESFEASGDAVCKLDWALVSSGNSLGSVALGVHVEPWTPSSFAGYNDYYNVSGVKSSFITNLHSWKGPGGYEGYFPANGFDAAYSGGYVRSPVPVWGWSTADWSAGNQSAMSQDAILRGDHDAFINTVASQVAAWGKPVIIRMFWEMNSNWMGWSPGVYGNTPQKLVASWKKIVDMFRARGAANAKWAWCPNHKGPGGSPMAAPLTDFYPGDAYVDWIGLDSYNMASAVGNPWIEFEPLLAASYDEVCAITPDKPFMLGEVGCHNASGGWFDGMHESIPRRFPRIKAVAWWNRNLDLQSKINTSAPSLEAWKRMATDPYFSAVL